MALVRCTVLLSILVLAACDEARGTPTHVPDGPMAAAAKSLEAMSACQDMGKVTGKNGPNADFEMRQKAAAAGATHVYRMPNTDNTGFGSGFESHDRVYGQMYKCGAGDSGADGGR